MALEATTGLHLPQPSKKVKIGEAVPQEVYFHYVFSKRVSSRYPKERLQHISSKNSKKLLDKVNILTI